MKSRSAGLYGVMVCAAGLAAMVLTGCQQQSPSTQPVVRETTPKRPPKDLKTIVPPAGPDPNIVAVHAYYNPYDPCIWNDARTQAKGIDVQALYLEGPIKGVFGEGIIRPKMYVRQMMPDGKFEWKLVKEWSFTVEQALPFRSRRPSTQGWGYRLPLQWDENMDLAGRQVRMVIDFQRPDGSFAVPSRKDFRIPNYNK